MLKWPVSAQPVFSSFAPTSTEPNKFPHPVGSRGEDVFGRTYRYCIVGAVDLVVGNVIQAAAQITNHQQLTPSVGNIGDTQITATAGATAANANDYAGGIAVIDTTPGLGFSYPIIGHAAWTSGAVAGGVVVNFTKGWAEVVAITGTSRVSLAQNPYRNVIQAPVTTATNVAVGCCQFVLPALSGGWLGVTGQFGTLNKGTAAVGSMMVSPGSVAGSVVIAASTLQVIGSIMVTGVDAKVQPVFWQLG